MNQPIIMLWQAMLDEVRKAVQEEVRNAMPVTAPAEEDLHPYTVQETAKMLNCCRQSVHEYVRTGRLRVHKLGARSYFFRDVVLYPALPRLLTSTPMAALLTWQFFRRNRPWYCGAAG